LRVRASTAREIPLSYPILNGVGFSPWSTNDLSHIA
jgi:hypothetical protein